MPALRPADSRSKFLEAFHHLLHRCSVFYKEDNDTTVIADGFPLLNALKEVHLLLAEGAHNQFGDLPWTARAEMLIQQWLLSRPEMRDFLQGRRMVPYKEPWMAQVDTMKSLQGWTDIPVTHFRDLGVYGEQILLTIRYGDWIDINNEDDAKNWARYWRPEIQGYLHAYRAVDRHGPDQRRHRRPHHAGHPPAEAAGDATGQVKTRKMRTQCACGCCGTCAQQPRDPTISEGTMNRFEAQRSGDYEFEAFNGAELETRIRRGRIWRGRIWRGRIFGRRVRGRVGGRGARPSPAACAAGGGAGARLSPAGGFPPKLQAGSMVLAIALLFSANSMGNANELRVPSGVAFVVQLLVASLVHFVIPSCGATVPVGTARPAVAMVSGRSVSGPVLAVRTRSELPRRDAGLGQLRPLAAPLSLRPIRLRIGLRAA